MIMKLFLISERRKTIIEGVLQNGGYMNITADWDIKQDHMKGSEP